MIHQFINIGYRIVLDVHSGSVHVVDDLVYDVIAVLDRVFAEDEAADALTNRRDEAFRAVSQALSERYEKAERLAAVRAKYFEAFDKLKDTETVEIVDAAADADTVEERIWAAVSKYFNI